MGPGRRKPKRKGFLSTLRRTGESNEPAVTAQQNSTPGGKPMESQGTLLTLCGAHRMSRSELTHIPSPAPTATWKPIRHSELIEQLDLAFQAQGLHIWREQFAVQHHDHQLFGVLDLSSTTDDFRAALGVRTSNDKTFAIQLAVGLRGR